jgi:hypothetical protein
MAESPAKLVERSRASNSDFPATLDEYSLIRSRWHQLSA